MLYGGSKQFMIFTGIVRQNRHSEPGCRLQVWVEPITRCDRFGLLVACQGQQQQQQQQREAALFCQFTGLQAATCH